MLKLKISVSQSNNQVQRKGNTNPISAPNSLVLHLQPINKQ
jgi:hypothetical protein